MKKQLLLLVAGVAAVFVLVWLTDFNEVFAVLLDVSISVLVLVTSIQLSKYILLSIQWKSIVKASGHQISLGRMTHIVMSGKFVECITPGFKVGGEITKTIMLTKLTPLTMAEAIAVTATQKALNIMTLLLLCLGSIIALLTNIQIAISPSLRLMLVVATLSLLCLCLVFVGLIAKPNWITKYLPQPGFVRFRRTMITMCRRPVWLLGQLALTITIWLTYAIISIFIARALGLGLRDIYVVMTTYLSYMLGLVPLLPGGLGTTEAGLTGILSVFGVSVTKAVAMTLLLRAVTYWFVLLTSALWFFGAKVARIAGQQKPSQTIEDRSPPV